MNFVSFLNLLLGLLTSAVAVNGELVPRQSGLGRFGLGRGSMASRLVKKLQPQHDSKASRELRVWGPFKLNAINSTRKGMMLGKLDPNSDVFSTGLAGICTECVILAAAGKVSDANGNPLGIEKGVYTHHIVLFDLGRRPVVLPLSPQCRKGSDATGGLGGLAALSGVSISSIPSMMSIIADQDPLVFASKDNQQKSGFFVRKNDRVTSSMEVINYDKVDKEIYLSLDYEFVPGSMPTGYLDTGFGLINIDGCGGNVDIHPPNDRSITYKSNEYIAGADGYIVNFIPHLHDGGINIEVFRNNSRICHSEAIYGIDGGKTEIDGKSWQTIMGYTPCETAVKISRGDVLSMTAMYDYTKHRARPISTNHHMQAEAMAIAKFIFGQEPKL